MMRARRLTSAFTMWLCVVAFPISALSHAGVEQQSTTEKTSSHSTLQQEPKSDETLDSLRATVKRNKNDLTAWNHLGLVLEQKGDQKEARKAHEKAAKLGDKLLAEQLNEVTSGADFSSRLIPLAPMLAVAGASAEKYIQLAKLSGEKLQEWKLRADALQAYAEIANAPPGTPALLTGKEVSVKARVIAKPEPQYTEEARKAGITGIVVLRAILAANGRLIGIRVVKGLSGGLTERAIVAARKIKFTPAMKDGRPVSMFIQIEYSFNLY